MENTIKISEIQEENGILTFNLDGVNVSYANGIRRTILSEIPCVVIKGYPHDVNDVNITTNNTRLNNELLKQRLCSIPIHITDIETFPIDDYELYLNVENDTNEIKYVTSEDFKIKNIKTEKFLENSETKKIFPPDIISGHYIDLVRLRPYLDKSGEKDKIELTAKFSISNAKYDGMYNMVSTCSYGMKQDQIAVKEKWDEKLIELKKNNTKEQIEKIKKDWLLLDAKRIYIEDSFDFIIETVGIFQNIKLVEIACEIIIKKLQATLDNIKSNYELIKETNDTKNNSYEIVLENEDYTVGKIIEYNIIEKNFTKDKSVNFVSFFKKHPHDTNSLIKISFINTTSKDDILIILEDNINKAILTINEIRKYFSNS